jgi:photosystem II stability/assembly factor-like uncharacterized protein
MTSLIQLTKTTSRFVQVASAYRPGEAAALCAAARILSASLIFITSVTVSADDASSAVGFHKWSIEELQPPIKPGGRANTIAVHPKDNNLILVASESGGLFRSENGGDTWTHVDSLHVLYTNAVAFAKDPKVALLTASEDSSVSNHGGIWRSEDGGKTWTQIPSPSPPSWAAAKRLSAYEISIAADSGKIYVASSFGLLISDDPQGKTWNNPVDPFSDLIGSSYDRRVLSAAALSVTAQACDGTQGGGNLVLAGGRAGIRRSVDGGKTWCKPAQSTGCNPDLGKKDETGCIVDMHALGRSPTTPDHAYVAVPSYNDGKLFMRVYQTVNGGDTWTLMHASPQGTIGAGGIAFVKAIHNQVFDTDDLYFSNRLTISKGITTFFPYCTDWGSLICIEWSPFVEYPATSEAGDTRDIAFNSKNEPILAATDGGVIKAPLGPGIWTFAGANNRGNGPNGFNALQIYELQGQWIANTRHDVYFGTQDNSLWSSASSTTDKFWTACCNEGGFIEGEYHVAAESDAQITFSTGFRLAPDGNSRLPGLLFPAGLGNWAGAESWPAPLGPASGWPGWPKIIWKNFHVQGIEELNLTDPFGIEISQKRGLAFTPDQGKTWKQYAIIADDRLDLPRLSISGKGTPQETVVLYQAIRADIYTGASKIEKEALARIVKKKDADGASVSYPAMTNFGAFGMGPTMNANYRVFAVDPDDVDHLIAPDSDKGRMMETTDGGDTWTEIPKLTQLVKDGGKLNFTGVVFFNGTTPWYPSVQATAISFYADDPNMVAVGTLQNGIFISSDRGKTWKKVTGSEKATLISSMHWRRADDLIVSTYGRGLWRVRFQLVMPVTTVFCNSPDCFPIYLQPPPGERPSPYDQVAIAYGGHIEGARVADGILRELFVQPSTTIVFAADPQQVRDINVTETTTPVGFQGIPTMPRPPEGARIITGLTLKKRGEGSELVGFLFSPRLRSLYTPKQRSDAEERPVGRTESPTAGKPYLELLTGSVTVPNGRIQIAGRNLRAGSPVEIAFDGSTVQRVVPHREGRFSSAVQAPSQFGIYSLTLIDSATGRVLNGAMVSVRPEDRPPSR